MSIKSFIQDQVFLPRLAEKRVVVVYDPDQRYRELCLGLATETRPVIDAGAGSIESREAAMWSLQQLGRADSKLEGLLVYVPAAGQFSERGQRGDQGRRRDGGERPKRPDSL